MSGGRIAGQRYGAGGGLFASLLSGLPTQAGTGFSSWLHQPAGATVTQSRSGLVVSCPSQGSTVNFALLKAAAPATPYVITALIADTPYVGGTGICLGWSDGAKLEQFFIESQANSFEVVEMATAQTASTTVVGEASYAPLHWLQLSDDGTTITFGASSCGEAGTFRTIYSVAKASGYLGAGGYTNLVFGVDAFSQIATATLLSWSVAA